MKRSVIDIGTNTTHLMIAEVNGQSIEKIIYKKRYYTFLGESGMHTISDTALDRLFHALGHFHSEIKKNTCTEVAVIATDALRSATNGPMIHQRIQESFGWHVHIIEGQEESELIYQGVKLSVDMSHGSFLIMDVGGGSVEFIWVENGEKRLQKSYPIGISRLYHSFHKKEPFLPETYDRMYNYLEGTLTEMWNSITDMNCTLIGCAGTFEIFLQSDSNQSNHSHEMVKRDRLEQLYAIVQNKSFEERQLVKDLPRERAQYIVVALALIRYVLSRLESNEFIVSKYALKEGAIIISKYF